MCVCNILQEYLAFLLPRRHSISIWQCRHIMCESPDRGAENALYRTIKNQRIQNCQIRNHRIIKTQMSSKHTVFYTQNLTHIVHISYDTNNATNMASKPYRYGSGICQQNIVGISMPSKMHCILHIKYGLFFVHQLWHELCYQHRFQTTSIWNRKLAAQYRRNRNVFRNTLCFPHKM